MFRKAGHIRRKRNGATDAYGVQHDILTLSIDGQNYALKINDLMQVLYINLSASIERIKFHWQDYLEEAVGTTYLSRSGKAVILELFTGQRYCIPTNDIRAVVKGLSGYAIISGIPASDPVSHVPHHAGTVQMMLSAF